MNEFYVFYLFFFMCRAVVILYIAYIAYSTIYDMKNKFSNPPTFFGKYNII